MMATEAEIPEGFHADDPEQRELKAMRDCSLIVCQFDNATRRRILDWLDARYPNVDYQLAPESWGPTIFRSPPNPGPDVVGPTDHPSGP